MNYELSKKLKEAGFRDDIYLYPKTQETGNEPTLRELIDACGDRINLIEIRKQWLGRGKYRLNWVAHVRGSNYKRFRGSTPEEAVALLWIYLNKKNAHK